MRRMLVSRASCDLPTHRLRGTVVGAGLKTIGARALAPAGIGGLRE